MILAHNLNAAMKRLVLWTWVAKRMKALRFALIGLPGRVIATPADRSFAWAGGGKRWRRSSTPARG